MIKHFLAYGHSDQVSFRALAVQKSFDYLSVPGTIAAYYPDATAGFVLSSNLHYAIDPRTPLFQGSISVPKASHYSLASWHGTRVREHMGDDKKRRPVSFEPSFYTPDTIKEMVEAILSAQRNYGGRAADIQGQLDRYSRLAAEAQGTSVPDEPVTSGEPPSFVLAPYFVTTGTDSWVAVDQNILSTCAEQDQAADVCPVIAVSHVGALSSGLDALPPGLSSTAFFWVDRFNERTVTQESLEQLWSVVAAHSDGRPLVNLYGGFFSICLAYAGLWGFNNGLGYSESRDWPELPSTGAPPARYYLRPLHMYVAPALAEFIVEREASFRCDCPVCVDRSIVSLSFHDLKRHFALSRRWEIELVHQTTSDDLASQLDNTAEVYEQALAPRIPPGLQRVDVNYLRRWASVLRWSNPSQALLPF